MLHKDITIVTGLWDLGRGGIEGWAKRDFKDYKNNFLNLLKNLEYQTCVWIPKELEEDVIIARGGKPTKIFIKEKEDFRDWFPFFKDLQEIRTSPNWYNKASWIKQSPQALLEYYNPVLMCKMFMLNDSAIINPFDSDYFYWLDGGIGNTVNVEYFKEGSSLTNLTYNLEKIQKFLFLTYPYQNDTEVHGFDSKVLANFCNVDKINKVSRGGFFGGIKEHVHKINELYYNILHSTITSGYMGADECLFTILAHLYKDLIITYEIDYDGLVWVFFEEFKEKKDFYKMSYASKDTDLYIISYNSPKQFQSLINTIENYDNNIINNTNKYLLNNSIDKTTDLEYSQICQKYNFIEIKKDNIGICGGRQFVSEFFERESKSKYYLFFEDDMFFYTEKDNKVCKNGFNRTVKNILNTSISILETENLDFLKLSFSEFFGDNSKQWAWFNVPQDVREKFWQDNTDTSKKQNIPNTDINYIGVYNSTPYAVGDIFYSNWPQIVSRQGNRKMFLETTWEHPYEQTWMSYIFQKTKEKYIKAGVLLLSPIEHNRFDHYPKEERREN